MSDCALSCTVQDMVSDWIESDCVGLYGFLVVQRIFLYGVVLCCLVLCFLVSHCIVLCCVVSLCVVWYYFVLRGAVLW